jgi:hypothetical protein
VATDSVVIVGSNDGNVRAFDKKGRTGCSGTPVVCAPLWSAFVGGQPTTPTAAGEKVYVTANGSLSAFDATGVTGCGGTPKTCVPLWTISPAQGSPVVVDGTLYVSTGSTIGAFDATGSTGCGGSPRTCSPRFTTRLAPCPAGATRCEFSDPSVVGGRLYAMWWNNGGLGAAAMETFDAAGSSQCTGNPKRCSPLWSTTLRANADSAGPTVSGGRVFVQAEFIDTLHGNQPGATLEALDASNGGVLWIGGGFPNGGPLGIDAGRLYVGAGHVQIYDAAGVQGCSVQMGVTTCQPVITLTAPDITSPLGLANGVLYTSGIAGVEGSVPHFKAYDIAKLTPTCGTVFASCVPDFEAPTISLPVGSPAIVDGFAYVTTSDGKLHAFSLPT